MRNWIAVVVSLMVMLFWGMVLGRCMERRQGRYLVVESMQGREKLDEALALIATQYVDSISMDSLSERAIPVLLEELDPHSSYIPRTEMAEVNEPIEGEFDGIGVAFNMASDTVVVLNVIPAGPSDRAGVRAGDRVMRIDDSLVAGRKIPQMQIVKRLRGKRGTKVRLGIERAGAGMPVEVTVTRGVIPIHSVEASFMLTPGVGYVRLSQFSMTSAREVRQALSELNKQGMRSLVFDLRGNSGGIYDQAIRIAELFLPKGAQVVYTEDRFGNRVREFAGGGGDYLRLPLAVLVDEWSASASEIVAGALQDNDRATIVGRRTFGKGLVQRQFPFEDGSAMRLTIARYYTPTGRSIQKPYAYGAAAAYNDEMWERYRKGELFSADSIRFVDSLKKTTPGGRVVYGGGGIMPDTFVGVDTTAVTKWFLEVSGRNILYRYTMDYADRRREAINSLKTMPQLEAFLGSDRSLFEDFVRYATKSGVQGDPKQIARSRTLVLAQLRAYIGRNSPLGEAAFFYEIYPVDETMRAGVNALRK